MAPEAVFSDFRGRLRAFLARRLRDPEDVEDLLQEVFLRIHRSGTSLAEAERPQAWLFQITRNALIDHYRADSFAKRRVLKKDLERLVKVRGPEACK